MSAVQQGPTDPQQAAPPATSEDLELVQALRNGDERAFVSLIDRYHPALVRLATLYVSDRAVAEEVAQETWLGVLQGIGRFEGRSSLKTWLFRILTNRAKTRGERERRAVPFSILWQAEVETDEPSVDPERFLPPNHPQWPGHWSAPPRAWQALPDERAIEEETRARIERAIAQLPPVQGEVIRLRDVEGWTAEEVCNVLSISETNQRVMLHRARSKVRRAIEQYFGER